MVQSWPILAHCDISGQQICFKLGSRMKEMEDGKALPTVSILSLSLPVPEIVGGRGDRSPRRWCVRRESRRCQYIQDTNSRPFDPFSPGGHVIWGNLRKTASCPSPTTHAARTICLAWTSLKPTCDQLDQLWYWRLWVWNVLCISFNRELYSKI